MKLFKRNIFSAVFVMVLFNCIMSAPLFAQEDSATEGKERKNVLVVNSYHIGYEWADNILKGIQSARSDNNLNVFVEHMDSKRYPDDLNVRQFEETLRYKYSAAKIDAIIVSDHNAFYLMLEMRKTFHPDVPLVFCGIDQIDFEAVKEYEPIYGLLEGDGGIGSTLDLILSIQPNINKLIFVADQTMSAEVMLGYVRDYESSYKGNVAFEYLINMSTDGLKVALENVPQNSAVMWLHFLRDKNGNVFSLKESQTFVAKNASVPVYACYGFSEDTGVMGGSIIHGFDQGEKAGKIALQLLNTESPVPIPFLHDATLRNEFNYTAMKRFNIGINDLPENSVIYKTPSSVLYKYRWQIIGIVLFMVFQTLLIGLLLVNQRNRKQAEEDLLKEKILLKTIIDNIPVMLTRYNPHANMLYLNKEFEKKIGWNTEEVQDIDMMEKVYPDPDYRQQAMDFMLKANLEWREFTVMSKSGEPIDSEWSNFRMEDGTQIGIGIDITERKQAEEKRERILTLSTGLICIAGMDGYFKYVNPAWEKLLGYTTQELLSRPFLDFIHPDDHEINDDEVASLSQGEKTIGFRNRYVCKDGSTIPVDWIATPYPKEELIYCIGRDITIQNQKEEELLKHAETKEVLLREVNHRVKNNLSAIMGMIYKEEDRAEEHGSKQDVEMLRDLVGRVKGLSTVHSLLSSSGWQPLLLTELCEKVISSALQGLSSDEKPSLDIAKFPVKISSDQAHHLTLVINELTTNSIKHGLKGPDGIHIGVGFNKEGKRVQIIYRDNGPGYPKDMVEKKISPTGIGFDLILGIVNESLGGNVQIDYDNGAVTTITFNIDEVEE